MQLSSKTQEPSTAQDVMTMQHILEKLYRAENISRQESQALFGAIIRGELEASQLAAALISMKVRGEHPDEIAVPPRPCWPMHSRSPALTIYLPISSAQAVTAPTASTFQPLAHLSPPAVV